jgi:hypothetical protein
LKYRRAELRKAAAILSHLAEAEYKLAAIGHRQIEKLARRARWCAILVAGIDIAINPA